MTRNMCYDENADKIQETLMHEEISLADLATAVIGLCNVINVIEVKISLLSEKVDTTHDVLHYFHEFMDRANKVMEDMGKKIEEM